MPQDLRAQVCRADEIDRLRTKKGYTIKRLANKAGIDPRTLKRILKGERAFLETIVRLAKALDVPPESIVQLPVDAQVDRDKHFRLNLTLAGSFASPTGTEQLVRVTPELISTLEKCGFAIAAHETELALTDPTTNPTRIVLLIWGKLESGQPYWVYVAVRRDRYDSLIRAYATHRLNLYQFDPYGEIIVSGDGEVPPADVTAKVAEMFKCDVKDLQSMVNARLTTERELPGLAAPVNESTD